MKVKTRYFGTYRSGKEKGKVNVQRFKGLGEMNPLQLRETTMSPDTRRLVQLVVDDSVATNQIMDMLLAKNAPGIANPGWKIKVIWRR